MEDMVETVRAWFRALASELAQEMGATYKSQKNENLAIINLHRSRFQLRLYVASTTTTFFISISQRKQAHGHGYANWELPNAKFEVLLGTYSPKAIAKLSWENDPLINQLIREIKCELGILHTPSR